MCVGDANEQAKKTRGYWALARRACMTGSCLEPPRHAGDADTALLSAHCWGVFAVMDNACTPPVSSACSVSLTSRCRCAGIITVDAVWCGVRGDLEWRQVGKLGRHDDDFEMRFAACCCRAYIGVDDVDF